MKYEFDVSCHENENVIKVTIGFGSMSNSVTRTIRFEDGEDYDELPLNELLLDMVDNIRLTVNERKEAMYNVKVFNDYVQLYGVNTDRDTSKETQMIVENEDPPVLSLS
jgi:hypothetical protein